MSWATAQSLLDEGVAEDTQPGDTKLPWGNVWAVAQMLGMKWSGKQPQPSEAQEEHSFKTSVDLHV